MKEDLINTLTSNQVGLLSKSLHNVVKNWFVPNQHFSNREKIDEEPSQDGKRLYSPFAIYGCEYILGSIFSFPKQMRFFLLGQYSKNSFTHCLLFVYCF